MKMTTENDKNRVGIYTQESVEATATGEGLAPQGDKSPVVNPESITIQNEQEEEEKPIDDCATNQPLDEDDRPDLPDQENSQSGGDEDHRQADEDNSQNIGSSKGDDSHSNYSRGDAGLKIRTAEDRDRINRSTNIIHFPQCEQHYGKNRWGKTIGLLKKIGFVNWEVNTMLSALDKLRENQEPAKQSRKRPHAAESSPNACEKVPRPAGGQQKSTDVVEQSIDDPNNSVKGMMRLTPTPVSDILVHINIGDASHPKSHILPENELKLEDNLMNLLNETKTIFNKDKKQVKVSIYRIFFINHILVAECKNATTVDIIRHRLSELNHLWKGANLVVCDRVGTSAKIEMLIPYSDMKADEIMEAFRKQNQIDTSSWEIIKQEDVDEDQMCLHVEIDATASIRLFHDQDDLYFLLKRVVVKLLQE